MAFPTVGAMGFSGPWLMGGMIERKWANKDAGQARDFEQFERIDQNRWQEEMANTAWQRGVEDMKKAGINPMLSAAQGHGANVPSGMMGPSIQAKSSGFPTVGSNANVTSSYANRLLEAQAGAADAKGIESLANAGVLQRMQKNTEAEFGRIQAESERLWQEARYVQYKGLKEQESWAYNVAMLDQQLAKAMYEAQLSGAKVPEALNQMSFALSAWGRNSPYIDKAFEYLGETGKAVGSVLGGIAAGKIASKMGSRIGGSGINPTPWQRQTWGTPVQQFNRARGQK